jgi:hypothetical protein
MRRSKTSVIVLVLMCGSVSCSVPSISRLDVAPPVLCEGDKAVVTWDAKGTTALAIQQEPSERGTEDCFARGRETFAVTLSARSGSDEVESRAELVQLQSAATEPVALRTNAVEDGYVVVASGDKNPALWDSRVEVASIQACQNRSITVQHAGRSVVVGPGAESVALAGTSVSGLWELRSKLTDEEVKTPSLRPKELTVLATIRCRE